MDNGYGLYSAFRLFNGSWNHSYKALTKTGECVIAIPAVDLAKKTVQIGSCSGAEVNKFEKFKLTPLKAEKVSAPLIKECYANMSAKLLTTSKSTTFLSLTASRRG